MYRICTEFGVKQQNRYRMLKCILQNRYRILVDLTECVQNRYRTDTILYILCC
jgi:hypothetical protein